MLSNRQRLDDLRDSFTSIYGAVGSIMSSFENGEPVLIAIMPSETYCYLAYFGERTGELLVVSKRRPMNFKMKKDQEGKLLYYYIDKPC